ncbi:uncharacterized protein EV420DRAFT_1545106 [Desarmillaria tabescens]|uniref:Uncharacterized protein n=1 Tax=Armillaria tabescens TaxID=1929756 RepID=A0AA39KEJ7_ARMTA|nr:uncharacterized protein EV420DRAFT_1545106 [Desarmillaria tabescens]KAK0458349.1 hypothetical protein EV420DRAFT_1545106 [Desarmillaria tabescens]
MCVSLCGESFTYFTDSNPQNRGLSTSGVGFKVTMAFLVFVLFVFTPRAGETFHDKACFLFSSHSLRISTFSISGSIFSSISLSLTIL